MTWPLVDGEKRSWFVGSIRVGACVFCIWCFSSVQVSLCIHLETGLFMVIGVAVKNNVTILL